LRCEREGRGLVAQLKKGKLHHGQFIEAGREKGGRIGQKSDLTDLLEKNWKGGGRAKKLLQEKVDVHTRRHQIPSPHMISIEVQKKGVDPSTIEWGVSGREGEKKRGAASPL